MRVNIYDSSKVRIVYTCSRHKTMKKACAAFRRLWVIKHRKPFPICQFYAKAYGSIRFYSVDLKALEYAI